MEERNWAQYNSPKNIAMSLTCEAAELLEIFRWLTEEESFQVMHNSKTKEAVQHEIGDVLINIIYLASLLDVDLVEVAHEKLSLIGKKYPVSDWKGKRPTGSLSS